jgi:hypothetical protein
VVIEVDEGAVVAVDRVEAEAPVAFVVEEIHHEAVVVGGDGVVVGRTDRTRRRSILGDAHGRDEASTDKSAACRFDDSAQPLCSLGDGFVRLCLEGRSTAEFERLRRVADAT